MYLNRIEEIYILEIKRRQGWDMSRRKRNTSVSVEDGTWFSKFIFHGLIWEANTNIQLLLLMGSLAK